MRRGNYFNKQREITSDDINYDIETFDDAVKDYTKIVLDTDSLDDGEGEIIGTSTSHPDNLKVEIVDTDELRLNSGSVIDVNGEYIELSSSYTFNLADYYTGGGTYHLYIKYTESGSNAKQDDENNSYNTHIHDSYEFDLTKDSKSSPWIKLADVVVAAFGFYRIRNYNDDIRLQTAVTDRGVYLPSDAVGWSEGWQKTLYDHIHSVGSGTVSSSNPHGVPFVSDWEDIENKPLYLYKNQRHGNAYTFYDPNDDAKKYSSHFQDVDSTSTSSGSVRVGRWGTYCAHTRLNPDDTPDTNYPYKSSPNRQGGTTIWVDGATSPGKGPVNVTLDAGIDWRNRWIMIEGFITWRSYGDIYIPGEQYQDKLFTYIDYVNKTVPVPQYGLARYFPAKDPDTDPDTPADYGGTVVLASFFSYIGCNMSTDPKKETSRAILLDVYGAKFPVYIYAKSGSGILCLFVEDKALKRRISGSIVYYSLAYSLKIQASPQAYQLDSIPEYDPYTEYSEPKFLQFKYLTDLIWYISDDPDTDVTNDQAADAVQVIYSYARMNKVPSIDRLSESMIYGEETYLSLNEVTQLLSGLLGLSNTTTQGLVVKYADYAKMGYIPPTG